MNFNLFTMRKIVFFFLVLTTFSQAQNFSGLDKSPMDRAKYPTSNRITDKVAIITYSRPQLKGRAFEDVVPQNKVWRTGANEASELRLFADIKIENTTVSAGTYSIFTIVEEKAVTFILNSATNVWGAYAYNAKNDVLRINVPRAYAEESLEAFSIAFSDQGEQPKIHMGWGNVRFDIPFTIQ